jgi:Asp-tRNA(Asn)/Glu-tRNA(Gln) amidotransferase A subunit family amidase
MSSDLLRASAPDIAAAVRRGDLSAASVVDRALEAALTSQDEINAFTLIASERARRRAAEIDEAVAAGTDPGPLAGVPFAVKDLIDERGLRTTCGSSFPVQEATRTAPCVAALEARGAVSIGRTGLHEFAYGFSSENHWFGPVRNPWNHELSPGGSSGGSAAAVAAGVVPVALGTDTGGSVRVPAALCGVVGLKVTHGRGSLRGVFPLAASLDTVGPIGRTLADVAAAYAAIAAHDPDDPWSAPRPVLEPQGSADPGSLTIGVPRPLTDAATDPIVGRGFDAALAALEAAGAHIVEIEIAGFAPPGEVEASHAFEVRAVHHDRWLQDREGYGPEVRDRLAAAFEIDGDRYLDALRWRAAIRHGVERALTACDVLATPTVGALAKQIGVGTIEVDGTDLPYRTPLSRYTAVVNNLGMPALALPLPAAERPPPSLQLIGPAWSEHRLLEIGMGLEEAGITVTPPAPGWTE